MKRDASSLIDATTIKLLNYVGHVHTSFLFTSKNVFMFPKTLEKSDDQWGAVCIHWVTRAECDACETIRTFEGSLTPASQEV